MDIDINVDMDMDVDVNIDIDVDMDMDVFRVLVDQACEKWPLHRVCMVLTHVT